MLSKAQIKHIQALRRKKQRYSEGLYIAEGNKIVQELLDNNSPVTQIFALGSWIIHNQATLDQSEINYTEVNDKDLKRISTLTTPNEVLAIVTIPTQVSITESNGLTLILDGVSDPGNMGTIIRTADWFGIKQILCSQDCVDIYNPKVVQATMGSIARINVSYIDLDEHLSKQKGMPILGMVLNGDDLYQNPLPEKGYLIVGSESHGISNEVLNLITQGLTIPNYGKAESLNAGMACGIVLSHYRMQHPA